VTTRTRIFRYVKLDHLGAWLDVGWFYDGDVMHMPHGIYGCTVEWLCSCHLVEPIL
jgi:hypothetical protein